MFFITCFEKIGDKNDYGLGIGNQRTFGFTETIEEAEKCLKDNTCDMNEALYGYAIAEEMYPGIHPHVESRKFYKYDFNRRGFFEVTDAEDLEEIYKLFAHYTNLSLG